MTPNQIRLVRETFDRVRPIADVAAAMFYERLFFLDPSLRPMFARTDMREQGRKLMQTLAVVVNGVDKPERLTATIMALGARHGMYDVADEHYETVGGALLDTLADALGPEFTPAVRDGWATAYAFVAGVMQQGQRSVVRTAVA